MTRADSGKTKSIASGSVLFRLGRVGLFFLPAGSFGRKKLSRKLYNGTRLKSAEFPPFPEYEWLGVGVIGILPFFHPVEYHPELAFLVLEFEIVLDGFWGVMGLRLEIIA